MPAPSEPQQQPSRQASGAMLRLVSIVLVAALVLWLAGELTRAPIARNEAAQMTKVLATVLPAGGYDNDPYQDRIFMRAPQLLGDDRPLPVYRARQGNSPVAAVITAVTRHGYIGPIRMLVAITVEGRIEGVRVVGHEETPQLGDGIEDPAWIGQFAGRSLHDPEPPGWAVRRDAGRFDAITGATISSRAVIHAVRDAALFFEQNREAIFSRPVEQRPADAAGALQP